MRLSKLAKAAAAKAAENAALESSDNSTSTATATQVPPSEIEAEPHFVEPDEPQAAPPFIEHNQDAEPAQEGTQQPAPEAPEGNAEAKKFLKPRELQRIALSDDGSQVARLVRDDRYQQLYIQFKVKPEDAYIETLKAEGFRWNQSDNAWKIPLTTQSERASMDDQEKGARRRVVSQKVEALFNEIANGIRNDNGLPPVGRGIGE